MSKFKGELYPFQKEAVEFIDTQPASICALEMGLGKSIVSLYIACKQDTKTLVVCPAFLKKNWKQEIDKFTEGLDIDVVSYSKLSTVKDKYNCFIFDEAHYIKNPLAKRTTTASRVLMDSNPDKVVFLTGTPVKNRVPDIWTLMTLCYSKSGMPYGFRSISGYYKFREYFCNSHTMHLGHKKVKTYKGIKSSKVDELKKMLKPFYFRKRLDQVNLQLPDQIKKFIQVKDRSSYKVELANALEAIDQGQDLSSFISIKTANALSNVPYTLMQAIEIIESGINKVIIFTDHLKSAVELGNSLNAKTITGAMDADMRHDVVEEFKKSEDKYLVATIGALSTGVTINECNHMIFNDYSWVNSNMEQAEKRIHRIGQKSTCFYYYMLSSDIDKRIFKTLQDKKRDIDAIQEY